EGDALEPAIARLAETSVQASHREVIAGAHVPRLDLHAAVDGKSFRRFELIVGGSQADRAVCIAKTGGPGMGVGIVAAAVAELLRTIGVERIADAELEAREVGRLVHDHVVIAQAGRRVEGSAGCRLAEIDAEGAGDVSKVLAGDVGLATEV